MRTVPPFWRALTYRPSRVSVRAIFGFDGSLTSTSVMIVCVCSGIGAVRSGSGPPAPWMTISRWPWSRRSPP
jgi:hypothetical protein